MAYPVYLDAANIPLARLNIDDPLGGGGDGLTIDRHALDGSFGDGKIYPPLRAGCHLYPPYRDALYGGFGDVNLLVRTVGCEELVALAFGLQ